MELICNTQCKNGLCGKEHLCQIYFKIFLTPSQEQQLIFGKVPSFGMNIAKEVVRKKRERLKRDAIYDSLDKTKLLKLQEFEQLMSRFVQFGLLYVITTRGQVSCIGKMGTEAFRVFL